MTFVSSFQIGDTYTNQEIRSEFQCATQGGMRRSKKTNTLVLISNHTYGPYNDRWEDSTLMYTGMGLRGNQTLGSQNRTLAESHINHISIHLFEVFQEAQYIYVGQMYLENNPIVEAQEDDTGENRNVFVFPLKRISGQNPYIIPEKLLLKREREFSKKNSRLSKFQLQALALKAPKKANKRIISSTSYERNGYVSDYAKMRAAGRCELCKLPAPFIDQSKRPYLESHHIIWLANGGEDTIENTVALCPNCHRKMHIIADNEDILVLTSVLKLVEE